MCLHQWAQKDESPAATKAKLEGYASLYHLVKAQPFLDKVVDDRRRERIAVADSGNDRVTLFGYRPGWGTRFPGSLEGVGFVGVRSGPAKLKAPSSVSYNRWGDLAVCDAGHKRVLIFGPDQSLAHIISEHHHTLPLGYAPAPWLVTPISATFDVRSGRLAVSTKGGRVGLLKAPTPQKAGTLGRLTMAFMNSVLMTLDYRAAERLRGVCKFLHNITKQLRDKWQLLPMRTLDLAYVKVLFLDWARLPDGRPVPHSEAHDAASMPVCRKYLRGVCKRPHCPLAHTEPVVSASHLRSMGAVIELSHGVYCALAPARLL